MKTSFRHTVVIMSLTALAISLSACGGSDGAHMSVATEAPATTPAATTPAATTPAATTPAATAPAPAAPAAPAAPKLTLTLKPVKQFSFSWAAVPGATSYKLLENPDGSSGYTQVGEDIASDAVSYDLGVSLLKRMNARYILQSCNAGGCTDSAFAGVSGNLVDAVGKFKSSKPEPDDSFGWSVSLSADGNTLAVGAHQESNATAGINQNDDNSDAQFSGAVYVFTRAEGKWAQQAYVKSSKPEPDDGFGETVSLSADGNTLAVGAYGESNYSGAAYVFTRAEGKWAQQAHVKSSKPESHDYFGQSVSLSADGSTLAVGAYQESNATAGIITNDDNTGAASSGAVYVFTRAEGTWAQQAHVKSSNPQINDLFGQSVSLSEDGNTLAVGAVLESNATAGINQNDDNSDAELSGAVYVFTRAEGTWAQQAYVKSSKPEENDFFGESVSLSADGNTLAVGAYQESNSAAGINQNDSNTGAASSGAVYVFTREGNKWTQKAYVKSSNPQPDDYFGRYVSLSADGNTLAIGANGESNSSGAAYVY